MKVVLEFHWYIEIKLEIYYKVEECISSIHEEQYL